jgi:hypothetical protein
LTGQGGGNRYLGGVMKFLCLSVAAFAFALGACERHSWEDVKDEDGNLTEKGTKRLFEEHGHEEGAGHEGHEGAGHDADKEGHHEGGDADGHDQDEEKAPVPHDHGGDGTPDHD